MIIHYLPFTEERGPKCLLGPPTNDLWKVNIQGLIEAKVELPMLQEGFVKMLYFAYYFSFLKKISLKQKAKFSLKRQVNPLIV